MSLHLVILLCYTLQKYPFPEITKQYRKRGEHDKAVYHAKFIMKMNKKRLVALLIVLTLAMGLFSACGGGSQPAAQGAGGDPVTITIGHINAPTHPVHLGLLLFAEEIEARSGGTLTANIFDSAVIGGDISMIQQIVADQLDAAVIAGVCLWAGYDNRANFELLPFLFDNYQEAIAAFDGGLGQWSTENIIEPQGGTVIGYWINGLRQFTNDTRPLNTPADMAGLLFRTPQIEIHLDMYEALGTGATPMAFAEVYTSMQQGAIDGHDSPIASIHASRFFEVQRYISLSNHMYATGVFVVSDTFWAGLSAEHQQIVRDASYIGARHAQELTLQFEEEWIQEMIDNGNQINEVDLAAFRAAVVPLWEDWIARYGNEFVAAAAPYISDPDALAHRFA